MVQTAAGTFQLAGWWQRAGAWILDGLIVFVPILCLEFIIGASAYHHAGAFGVIARRADRAHVCTGYR